MKPFKLEYWAKDEKGGKVLKSVDVTVEAYKHAAEKGMTLRQYVKHLASDWDRSMGDPLDQMYANSGLLDGQKFGMPAMTLQDIAKAQLADGFRRPDGSDNSLGARLLYPQLILETMQANALRDDGSDILAIWESLIGVSRNINGTKADQPIIDTTAPAGKAPMSLSTWSAVSFWLSSRRLRPRPRRLRPRPPVFASLPSADAKAAGDTMTSDTRCSLAAVPDSCAGDWRRDRWAGAWASSDLPSMPSGRRSPRRWRLRSPWPRSRRSLDRPFLLRVLLVLGASTTGSGVATVAVPVSQLISRLMRPVPAEAGAVALGRTAGAVGRGAGCERGRLFTSASGRVWASSALFGVQVSCSSGCVTRSKLVLISSMRGSSWRKRSIW